MIALLLAFAIAQPELDAALSAAVKQSIERAAPSVVRIDLVGGGEGPRSLTGIVIDGEGRIVTSAHLFEKTATSTVATLPSGERVPAKLLGVDKVFHLAFLQIGKKSTPITAAPPERLQVGAYSFALGRGLSETPTASLGVVSALGRVLGKAIQTDAKTSPTNYGGPLLDLEGRAFGIIVPLSPDSGGVAGTDLYDSGIGFAIPMLDVFRSLERLKKGTIERGLLGLAWKQKKPLDGPLAIENIAWKSPAAEAGLRQGDVVKSAGGKRIEYYSQFRTAVGKLYAGDSMKLQIERDGKPIDVVVKAVAKLLVYRQPFLGMRLEEKSGKLEIQSVEGPSSTSGLKTKDVLVELDGPVKSLRDVETKLATKSAGDAFALVVEREGKRLVKALKSASWPETMPAPGKGLGNATPIEVPVPVKHWIVHPPTAPTALVLVVGSSKPDLWKAASGRQGITVVGSGERVPGEVWKMLLNPLQRALKLDARRTTVFGTGPEAEALSSALSSDIGAVAAEGGPISPPQSQPHDIRRYLVVQRPGGGSLIEAIKKARDEGVSITEFPLGDTKPESAADAVARWAAGLGRY
jgi:S1-C subfamily serine protease